MTSEPSKLQSALAFLRERLARLLAWARRHPILAVLTLPALLVRCTLALIPFTPSIKDLTKAKSATPSVVVSSDGVVLAEFKRLNRRWVPLDKISPSVIEALIATEDRRFYEHNGIDPRRTIAALLKTATGDLQGG